VCEVPEEAHENILFTSNRGSFIKQETVPEFEKTPPLSSVNNCTEILDAINKYTIYCFI
jgi:hypothetical protein